jgi:hypothetical protein
MPVISSEMTEHLLSCADSAIHTGYCVQSVPRTWILDLRKKKFSALSAQLSECPALAGIANLRVGDQRGRSLPLCPEHARRWWQNHLLAPAREAPKNYNKKVLFDLYKGVVEGTFTKQAHS